MSSSKLPLTGSKTAEVPVLRLRQAFWLLPVVHCKPGNYHIILFLCGGLMFSIVFVFKPPFLLLSRRLFVL
jgi:hypothetical protein